MDDGLTWIDNKWVFKSGRLSHTLSPQTPWRYLEVRGFHLDEIRAMVSMARDYDEPDRMVAACQIYKSLCDFLEARGD